MVPFFSAFLDLPKEQPLPCNADHSQIAKLRRSEGTKYYAVKAAMIKAIDSIFEPVVGRTILLPPDPAMQLELCTSVRAGDIQAVQRMLARGCSIHSYLDEDQVDIETDPFLLAAKHRQELIMRIFSKHSPDPRKCGTAYGSTALHLLSVPPDGEQKPVTESLITLLLQCGVAIEAQRKVDYAMPLLYSVACGQWEVAKILLDHGADVRAKTNNGRTALLSAALADFPGATDTGQLDVANYLLNHGADIHETSDRLRTALHFATQTGSTGFVDLLISRGAFVDPKDNMGLTPLGISCMLGFTEVFGRLLYHGADCHVKSEDGFTLLHLAALNDRPAIVEFLLSEGVPLNARTSKTGEYQTPLMCSTAHSEASAQSMSLLLKAGADTAAIDLDGRTALHWAARFGNSYMINELIAFGADIEAISGRHMWRPLHFAKFYGQWQTVEVLLQKGAAPRTRSSLRPSNIGWFGGDGDNAAPSDEDKNRCMLLLRDAECDEKRKRRTDWKPFWKR